jgi:hypothetical protein
VVSTQSTTRYKRALFFFFFFFIVLWSIRSIEESTTGMQVGKRIKSREQTTTIGRCTVDGMFKESEQFICHQ